MFSAIHNCHKLDSLTPDAQASGHVGLDNSFSLYILPIAVDKCRNAEARTVMQWSTEGELLGPKAYLKTLLTLVDDAVSIHIQRRHSLRCALLSLSFVLLLVAPLLL